MLWRAIILYCTLDDIRTLASPLGITAHIPTGSLRPAPKSIRPTVANQTTVQFADKDIRIVDYETWDETKIQINVKREPNSYTDKTVHGDPNGLHIRLSLDDRRVDIGSFDIKDYYENLVYHMPDFGATIEQDLRTRIEGCHEKLRDGGELRVTTTTTMVSGPISLPDPTNSSISHVVISEPDVRQMLIRAMVTAIDLASVGENGYRVYFDCSSKSGNPAKDVPWHCPQYSPSCHAHSAPTGCGWLGGVPCPRTCSAAYTGVSGPCLESTRGLKIPAKLAARYYDANETPLTHSITLDFTSERAEEHEPCSIWLELLYGGLLLVAGIEAAAMKSMLYVGCAFVNKQAGG